MAGCQVLGTSLGAGSHQGTAFGLCQTLPGTCCPASPPGLLTSCCHLLHVDEEAGGPWQWGCPSREGGHWPWRQQMKRDGSLSQGP